MKTNPRGSEKYDMGSNVLDELIEKNISKPDAYISQWYIEYKVNRNYIEALNIAE